MTDIKDIDADIDTCSRYIRMHQHATVECVAFKTSGKIEIVDKERLEGLNAEVDRLSALVSHNSKVLEQLTGALGTFPSLSAARERRDYVDGIVKRSKGLLRVDLANLIKIRADIDPADPFKHPDARKLKDETDRILADSIPERERVDKLIKQAEAIIADFQPSSLRPIQDGSSFSQAIIRDSVGGLV